jgi:hypothetical protein
MALCLTKHRDVSTFTSSGCKYVIWSCKRKVTLKDGSCFVSALEVTETLKVKQLGWLIPEVDPWTLRVILFVVISRALFFIANVGRIDVVVWPAVVSFRIFSLIKKKILYNLVQYLYLIIT